MNANATASAAPISDEILARLQACVQHLRHVLPTQAPLRDFVHHNTLHGFQHLPFAQALAEAGRLNGATPWLDEVQYRALFRQGRVTTVDLDAALRQLPDTDVDSVLLALPNRTLRRGEVLRAALLQAFAASTMTPVALRWQADEHAAFERLSPDIDAAARQRLLASAAADGLFGEAATVADLWLAARETLGLVDHAKQSANTIGISLNGLFDGLMTAAPQAAQPWESAAGSLWHAMIERLGREWTLSALLFQLTGEDVRQTLQPTLIRHLAAHLDQGVAAWHNPAHAQGFYAAWRLSAEHDWAWALDGLPGARRAIAQLPDEPLQVIVGELYRLGPDTSHWCDYLERLALELPGWSGMFLWRATHQPTSGQRADPPIDMLDYLAVRLVLERLHAEHLVHRLWQLPLLLSELGDYFLCHPAELWVRHAYSVGDLPEDLQDRLSERMAAPVNEESSDWESCAERLASWRATNEGDVRTSGAAAWPLFRLAQSLGLSGRELRVLGKSGVATLLQCAGELADADRRSYVWLLAYEHHYRQQVFAALLTNHGRADAMAVASPQPPLAQLVFCMDDREEGTRRHLEEVNPGIETFGAAGFFGLPMFWQGLDDAQPGALCPVSVRPQNLVREQIKPGREALLALHRQRRKMRLAWQERLHQGSRRGWWWATLLIVIAAPFALLGLFLRTLAPGRFGVFLSAWREFFDRCEIAALSTLAHTADAPESGHAANPDAPRVGFSEAEQVERVGGFLRSIGLTENFAPLVVLVGHGSDSRNNPHLAAYDCGACAGRHGGANARVFAALANRPEVRTQLAAQGILIASSTHFVGAEHNTCDESITWYDVDAVPTHLHAAFAALRRDIDEACRLHAVERCRRLASAPRAPSPKRALRHLIARRHDLGQVRPELGHATIAAAFLGRRAMSRGVFFDRRAFLISYDPLQDTDGRVLEATLLSVGPVGAGISLEYYFSKVDNARFGCGSKIMHNLVGRFGVMEGANSDLRTGLPRQMIEIHEAMRLLLVVEQTTEVIDAIYQRQSVLQELIGNGWIVLAAKHPERAQIHRFDPAHGWQAWTEKQLAALPEVERSADWFAGQRDALAPALLRRPLARDNEPRNRR
jgi:uncharacterized protein YbcC (UPF0753/DUF2309 family)